MKILLSSSHSYPAQRNIGAKLEPTPYPSSSAYATFDLLAKGLKELGQEVFYFLQNGVKERCSNDIPIITEPVFDVDINHRMLDSAHNAYWNKVKWDKPVLVSCHIHPKFSEADWRTPTHNWIYPSNFLATMLGSKRYVFNGIDPKEYIFSDKKDDYFIFIASMEWGAKKGLDTAIKVAQKYGKRLIVLGGAKSAETINNVKKHCESFTNVDYLGDVRGLEKAELISRAKCLLFPTELDESFGLVMAEALMSGTPVICSSYGACPELISKDVGFVCKTEEDYFNAVENLDTISSQVCREKAMNEYHYLVMAKRFIGEYEQEINNFYKKK